MPTREDTIVPEIQLTPEQLKTACERAENGIKMWATWGTPPPPLLTPWTEKHRMIETWFTNFNGIKFRISKESDTQFNILVTSETENNTISLYYSDEKSFNLAQKCCNNIIRNLKDDGYIYQKNGNEYIGVKIYGDSHVCVVCTHENEEQFEKFMNKLKTKHLLSSEDE